MQNLPAACFLLLLGDFVLLLLDQVVNKERGPILPLPLDHREPVLFIEVRWLGLAWDSQVGPQPEHRLATTWSLGQTLDLLTRGRSRGLPDLEDRRQLERRILP